MSPPSTPDTFPSDDKFDTLVTIEVGTGNDQRTFLAFKGVLCFYSGYFAAALNNDRYTETQNQVVKLRNEQPPIFDIFLTWIHTRCFFQSTIAPHVLLSFENIAKLWIFGDAHDIPMLQNIAANTLVEKFSPSIWPNLQAIHFIYDNTVPASRLWGLLVALFKWYSDSKYEAILAEKVEAMVEPEDIIKMLTERPDGLKMRKSNSTVGVFSKAASKKPHWHCTWHVHEEGTICRIL